MAVLCSRKKCRYNQNGLCERDVLSIGKKGKCTDYVKQRLGDSMGNIGYIFGYGLLFAFCMGVVVGYIASRIGDKDVNKSE